MKKKILFYIILIVSFSLVSFGLSFLIALWPKKVPPLDSNKNYKVLMVYGTKEQDFIEGEYDTSSNTLKVGGEETRDVYVNIYDLFLQHLKKTSYNNRRFVSVDISKRDFQKMIKRFHIWNVSASMKCNYEIDYDVVSTIKCLNNEEGVFVNLYFEF